MNLGTLAGGTIWEDCTYPMHLAPPPADTYTLVLMLREWTGNGYVTRDHRNSDHPLTFPIVMAAARQTGTPLTDEPAGPIVIPVRSSGPAPDTAAADPVGSPGQEAGRRVPNAAGESPGEPKAEVPAAASLLAGWKRYPRRFWDRIRKRRAS